MISDILLKSLEPSLLWDLQPARQQQSTRSNNISDGIDIDIKETELGYDISADIPGVSKDAVKIEIKDHILTINLEKKEEPKEENVTYHRKERFVGSASRSIRLPRDADEGSVEATHVNGVLHIIVKKLPATQARTVTIQ